MIEVLDSLDNKTLGYLRPVAFDHINKNVSAPKEEEDGHKFYLNSTGRWVLYELEVMKRRLFVEAFMKRLVEVGQDVTFIANLEKQLFAPTSAGPAAGEGTVLDDLLMKWDPLKAKWENRNRFLNMVLCLLDSLYYCSDKDSNVRLVWECLVRAPGALDPLEEEDEKEEGTGDDPLPHQRPLKHFLYKVEKKKKSPIRAEEYRFASYSWKEQKEEAHVVRIVSC